MLNWGITSVRLMEEDTAKAVDISTRSRTRSDVPDVFAAAPIFTTKGGWWDQGQPPDRNLNRFPATAAEARESVRKAKALGTREIKVMLDDMAWCRAPKPPLPKVSQPVLEALLGEARDLGLRAIVHAPNLEDAKAALPPGRRRSLTASSIRSTTPRSPTMGRRHVAYVPTMDIFEFLADPRGRSRTACSGPPGSPVERWLEPATVQRLRSREYSDHYRAALPEPGERLPAPADPPREPAPAEGRRRPDRDGHGHVGVPGARGVSSRWSSTSRPGSRRWRRSVPRRRRPRTRSATRRTGARSSTASARTSSSSPPTRCATSSNVRRIDAIWKAGERVGPRRPERRGP